jgi:trans-2-enoyl-CoA reductase
MIGLLGNRGQIVTYGAMSKSPLLISTATLLWKDLRLSSYWQSRWYTENSTEKRLEMNRELVKLISSGKVRPGMFFYYFISNHFSAEGSNTRNHHY